MKLDKEFLEEYNRLMAEDAYNALEYVLKAKEDSNNPDFYAYIADCYMTLEEFEKAIFMINKGLDKECQNRTYALSLKGEALFYISNYVESKGVFEELYIENPTSFFVIAYLMDIYIKLREYNKAIKIGNDILLKNELNNQDTAYIYVTIGWIKLNYLNDDNAIEDFNSALKLDNTDGRVYIGIGKYYLKNYKYEEALTNFDKAIDLNEGTTDVYYNIALCYKYMKMYEEAYEYLKVVCDAESDNEEYRDMKEQVENIINNDVNLN